MKDLREALAGRDEDRDLPPHVGTFLRGLTLGALVGAALAGSALLQRRRAIGDRPGEATGERPEAPRPASE
jgi:hypothetical protein